MAEAARERGLKLLRILAVWGRSVSWLLWGVGSSYEAWKLIEGTTDFYVRKLLSNGIALCGRDEWLNGF